MTYLISKFFDEDQIKKIKSSYKYCTWNDGLESYTPKPGCEGKAIKNNLQTKLSNPEILYQGMDQNSEFIDFTIARTTRDPLITRTPTGGYYRCHYDHWNLGDFSTTIFLNDSDTYAGGELCLWIDNKEERFKLDAGWGITYETGTCHMVSEVVAGERDAVVFWTKSWIRDMKDLYEARYWDMMAKRYEEQTKCVYTDLKEFSENLESQFREKSYRIKRKYLRIDD